MSRYLVHRSDLNAEQVYADLAKAGVTVERLGRPVDALLYYRGVLYLAEVKSLKGKVRSRAQKGFLARWPGEVLILRSAEDFLLRFRKAS